MCRDTNIANKHDCVRWFLETTFVFTKTFCHIFPISLYSNLELYWNLLRYIIVSKSLKYFA